MCTFVFFSLGHQIPNGFDDGFSILKPTTYSFVMCTRHNSPDFWSYAHTHQNLLTNIFRNSALLSLVTLAAAIQNSPGHHQNLHCHHHRSVVFVFNMVGKIEGPFPIIRRFKSHLRFLFSLEHCDQINWFSPCNDSPPTGSVHQANPCHSGK